MRHPNQTHSQSGIDTQNMSIEIDNPKPGQASHTSNNRATYLRQTQQAFITEEGKLHLLEYEKQEYYDRTNPDEAIWWNGSCDSLKQHIPGEVRS